MMTIFTCHCSCCAEAVHAIECDHPEGVKDACDCANYPLPQRCDCGFCLAKLYDIEYVIPTKEEVDAD